MAKVKDETLFARLFDVSPTPAVVTRLQDHTILAINQYTSELFGVAQDEAEGQSVLPYYVDAAARQRLADAVARKGRADAVLIHVKRRNGDTFWVQASARLVKFDGEAAVLTVFSDITDQLAAEEALRASEHRLETQSRVLTELTGRHTDRRGSFEGELHDILRAVAETLQVARVGMWRIDPDRRAIRCVSMFHRAENRFDAGAVLSRESAPDYFDALERDRVIAAEDVLTDPRTREFRDAYLVPNGIGAMLDIPLRQDDTMTGVLCSEHVGGRREWMFDEQNFAHSSANLIAIATADESLRDVVGKLADGDARLQAVLDAAPDAFVGTDASGRIVSWNARAQAMLGWNGTDVIGRPLNETIVAASSRDALASVLQPLLESAAGGGRVDLVMRHRDGRDVPIAASIAATRLHHGVFVGAFLREAVARTGG
jgi:PAS domain S-box-containing protein